MWSLPASPVRLRRALGSAAVLVVAGALMSACEGPTSPAEHALQQWLTDVRAHSVAYAYTLLSQNSEQRTNYDAFFAGVDQSHASYTIVSAKVISANDVEVMVAVKNPGATQPTLVKVQVLEEGNGGDWLVGAPFSTKGANAILEFR